MPEADARSSQLCDHLGFVSAWRFAALRLAFGQASTFVRNSFLDNRTGIQLGLDTRCFHHHNVSCQPRAFVKQKEDNLKTLVTFAICLILASPAFCQSTSAPKDQQEKEQQLRTALEQIRMAIDHYRGMADRGKFMVPVGSRNYPLDLETLVKGVVDAHGKTITFLPKIPVDPMTGTTDWGLKGRPCRPCRAG